MEKEVFAGLSVTCSIVSSIIYIRSILKHESKPHFFSWTVWGLLMLISSAAQYSDNAGAGVIASSASGICIFIIAGLAVFYGEKNITRSDWASFTAALAAIPLWWVTASPLLSVILITVIDLLGFYPTFRKSYRHPENEDLPAWLLSFATTLLMLLSIENYTLITSLYQSSIAISTGAFATMLVAKRKSTLQNKFR